MLLERIKIALLLVLVLGVFVGGVVLRDQPSAAADLLFVKDFGPRGILRLKDPEMQVTVLGERAVGDTVFDDHKALCVRLARKDGKEFFCLYPGLDEAVSEVLLYFDKKSNLLMKEEWSRDGKRYQIFCGAYQRVNGIAVARKLALQSGDGPVDARVEVEFEVPDRMDAGLFQKP